MELGMTKEAVSTILLEYGGLFDPNPSRSEAVSSMMDRLETACTRQELVEAEWFFRCLVGQDFNDFLTGREDKIVAIQPHNPFKASALKVATVVMENLL